MKKIKHIRDLEAEKYRLRIRQLQLEKELKGNWQDTKESLRPGTILKNKFREFSGASESSGEKGPDLFGAAVAHGAAWLTRQFVNTAGDKIEQGVQSGVEGLVEKIRNVFGKKTRKKRHSPPPQNQSPG